MTGEVMRTGKVVVLADAGADERVAQPVVRARVGPAVFVPLAVRGRTLGTLTVANVAGGPLLRETEVQLVETFAEQAGVALEYARLQGELQRLAVLEDRERIARTASGSPRSCTTGPSSRCSRSAWACRARPCWPATASCATASRTPSRSWTGSSATCATTSSACAPGSSPTASSTRPSRGWWRSSSAAPGWWPSPRSTRRSRPTWAAGPPTSSSSPARPCPT